MSMYLMSKVQGDKIRQGLVIQESRARQVRRIEGKTRESQVNNHTSLKNLRAEERFETEQDRRTIKIKAGRK